MQAYATQATLGDDVYHEPATIILENSMARLTGKEAALFDVAADADTAKEGLLGVLNGAEDAKRTRILTAVRENLEAM